MRKMPRNPFQDRINALNLKDLDEGLKVDAYLKKSSDPIPNDINNQNFPYSDFPQVNVLKPEELSMKDLLDQIQIETILNNNTSPFVEKKIKSEVTQEMIKDFQNESAKPVNINGTLYKFRPPDLDINIRDLPPDFPDEATYKADIDRIWTQEARNYAMTRNNLAILVREMEKNNIDYTYGRISDAEFMKARNIYQSQMNQLELDRKNIEMTMDSLQSDYSSYEEKRLEHVALVEQIKKENKQNLTAYEDEIRSRNTGMEVAQQEGESDEDYAQRMIDTAHTTVDPKQVEIQAQLYLYNTMKDRLGTMIQPYKAESILNQVIKVDGYDGLQVVKDRWPSLQKKLTDTFGDLRRVDNTDSIAIFILNETPENAILSSTPSSMPSIPPSPPTPNVSSTASTLKPYNTSTVTSITRPTIPRIYENRFANPPEVPDIFTSKNALFRPRLTPKGMFSKQSPPPEPIPPPIPPPPLTLEQRFARMGGSKNMIPFSKISNTELVDVLTQYGIRPVKHGLDMKAKNYDLVVKNGIVIRPTEPEPEVRKSPVKVKSPSKSPSKTRDKLPMDVISYEYLRTILDEKGLPFLSGNDSRSRKTNYFTALDAGLIPDRPKLKPKSEVRSMDVNELQQYLASEGIRGANGGDPTKQKSKEMLLRMYDRYATEEMRGSSIDIKSRFAIVDGEIQAGNNNPQLMRDARKLLKEMVQQKMVSLYEAQSHMKHLRKMNKI